MRDLKKISSVSLRQGSMVRVAPDDSGRFCVEDFNDSSGGLTVDAQGNELKGLSLYDAVRHAVRAAQDNEAHLEIAFDELAGGKVACWWAP